LSLPGLKHAFDSPANKRRHVRALFATIADRYDLITVLLSFGRDRSWKRRLVNSAGLHPNARVIDLACGTGDIAFEAARRGASVVGLDITTRMVELARDKAQREMGDSSAHTPHFLVGDMTALPFPSAIADVVTTGYGLRNVPVLQDAIDEIARVLKPGGRLLSLDFNRPQSAVVRHVYLTYLTLVGSALGWVLHRDPDTYRYIPESVRRYPGARGVADILHARGFDEVSVVPVFGGFMTMHVARRTRRTKNEELRTKNRNVEH
jgi:demethylmenaquinone methyltransferase / 2-methoxy-6-polyprenyl-1,4-benzoquinol methylase